MRKVLLRVVFDQLWKAEASGNEFLVGYGWVISLWILVATISLLVLWKMSKDAGQVFSSLIFWSLIPAAIAMVPVLQLPIANSGIPVFGYGFMLFVGVASATLMASRRAASADLDSNVIWDLMIWLIVPGIVGARIIYVLQNFDRIFANKSGAEILLAAIALWDGGIVFYGCVIGGFVGLMVFCRRRGIRLLQLADVIMPSLFIGLGFGRIGCFLYGCCFGAACQLPWAVRFPDDSMTFEALANRSAANGAALLEANGVPITARELQSVQPDAVLTTIALHPTQIYSSVLAFCLAGLLAWYFRRRPFEGAVVALGCILYPINRFVLEIIRDDEPGRLGTTLTFSQQISIGLFLTGCAMMYWLHRKHAADNTAA